MERDQRRAARRQADPAQTHDYPLRDPSPLMPSQVRIREHKQADPMWPRTLVRAIAKRTAAEREEKAKRRGRG